jgi:hypothetical protein
MRTRSLGCRNLQTLSVGTLYTPTHTYTYLHNTGYNSYRDGEPLFDEAVNGPLVRLNENPDGEDVYDVA